MGAWHPGRRSQTQPDTHLEGEGPQSRDGDQCSHEEGCDVADGCEGHAGSRALEALPGPVLRVRNHSVEHHGAGSPRAGHMDSSNTWQSKTTGGS